MIVIFEGPQGTGKTTLITNLLDEFKRREISAEQWKVERGTNPIVDMNSILDSGRWGDDKVFLLDRFHMSEWVISRATRRNWGDEAQWSAYESQLKLIDNRLREMDALLVFLTANPYFVQKRLSKLGKQDTLGGPQQADYHWRIGLHKTRCDVIHVPNNDFYQMRRNVQIIADTVEIRWARHAPAKTYLAHLFQEDAIERDLEAPPAAEPFEETPE